MGCSSSTEAGRRNKKSKRRSNSSSRTNKKHRNHTFVSVVSQSDAGDSHSTASSRSIDNNPLSHPTTVGPHQSCSLDSGTLSFTDSIASSSDDSNKKKGKKDAMSKRGKRKSASCSSGSSKSLVVDEDSDEDDDGLRNVNLVIGFKQNRPVPQKPQRTYAQMMGGAQNGDPSYVSDKVRRANQLEALKDQLLQHKEDTEG